MKIYPLHLKLIIIAGLSAVAILISKPSAQAQVPVISNIFPNGTVQFQPSNNLTFTASSPADIDPGGVTVQLTGTSLSGQILVTTLTTANGLIVGGTSANRTISAPLSSNTVYKVVINVVNLNTQSAVANVSFDKISPAYTFEAEDYDYGGGQFFNNPQTNKYSGRNVTYGIDVQNGNFGGGCSAYRPSGLNTEGNSDKPRGAYATGSTDYDVGWNDGGSAKWGNYTRIFPAGTFNVWPDRA